MKKNTIIFVVLFLIVLSVLFFNNVSININLKDARCPNNAISPTQATNIRLETKENIEGPVSIAVTPISLANGSPTWDFEIALNTHSQELNYDLITYSELTDDKGRLYKPTAWVGDNPQGHHRKGILKFNSISPKPKFIELKIKNIGGIHERSFKWNL